MNLRISASAIVMASLLAFAPSSAVAQDRQVGTSSIAERLFMEAKTLMQERQYERAW